MLKNRHLAIKLVKDDPSDNEEKTVVHEITLEDIAKQVTPIVKMIMIGTISTVAAVVAINVLGDIATTAIENHK
jgi:hypothetical protein